MKIVALDRVYNRHTGIKTSRAFVSLQDDNGAVSEYNGVFPDYAVGDEVEEVDERFVLKSLGPSHGGFKYEDEEKMWLFAKRKNAEFFYNTASFLPYESYEKVIRKFPNIALLYQKNPYILCEYLDESGKPYADFLKVDKSTDIKSFDARLKELKLAALLVLSRNESEGHTFMPYGEFDRKLKSLLEKNGHRMLTGDASAILSYFGDFYVEEPIRSSSRVAKAETFKREYKIENIVRMYEESDALFRNYLPPDNMDNFTDEQKDAVSGVILAKGRVAVLTGGPGTGKTTVISAILDGMEKTYPDVKVRLLASTGKAAKRIGEQMGDRSVEVSTIHKFIGYGMEWFTRDKIKSLKESGLVIVDESSMLDVEIMSMLLDKLDMEGTKIVLVGDENQLPSVSAGNVLHDIIAMGVPTFRLTVNHRNAGSIPENARKIIEGQSVFSLTEDESFKITGAGDTFFGYLLESMSLRRGRAFISPYHKAGKESSVFDINESAKEHKFFVDKKSVINQGKSQQFNLGDRVICTRTNYAAGYMNGDTGIYAGKCSDMSHSVRLDGQDRTVTVAEGDLELGYAITIHKSQGSEYTSVAIFIPKFSKFITRRMLYTAVTRAVEGVTIYADPFVIDEVIRNNRDEERRTMLGTLL